MKQQLKAVGMLLGMVAMSILVVVLVRLALANIGTATLPYVVGAGILGIVLYALYSICLAQIKYEDKLKELGKKYPVDQK